ncbi:hypothetical protein NP570_25595, partial [Vibrio parahaemolyticus]|nr:hypothetical protein [Vibrio parahaemolyticus]
ATAHPALPAHPVGTSTGSLRAPLNTNQGAVAVCGQFPTGGGREEAAGINALLKEDVNAFIDEVEKYYAKHFPKYE